jgi:hypothetical protein
MAERAARLGGAVERKAEALVEGKVALALCERPDGGVREAPLGESRERRDDQAAADAASPCGRVDEQRPDLARARPGVAIARRPQRAPIAATSSASVSVASLTLVIAASGGA